MAVLEGGRNSHGSLSSGWGAGRQLLPEDISERWKMASQAWGGVWTKWPWAGLARMVRLRGLRTGRKLPRPERTDTAFLSSGQRPRTGDSPGFSAEVPNPSSARRLVIERCAIAASSAPPALGEETTAHQPSCAHYGAHLEPHLLGPFDGGSRRRPAHIHLPRPPCLPKVPPRKAGSGRA